MKREQILESAFNDFSTYGIKRVSMDEIVQSLKISKKTLYEFFENKEELVCEAVKYRFDREIKRFRAVGNAQPNTLRSMMIGGLEAFKFFNGISPAFYNDVKFYPQLVDLMGTIKDGLDDAGRRNVQIGVKEGYLLPEANYDIFSELFRTQIMTKQKELIDKYTPAQICFISLSTILRGVATEKGRREIAEIEALNLV